MAMDAYKGRKGFLVQYCLKCNELSFIGHLATREITSIFIGNTFIIYSDLADNDSKLNAHIHFSSFEFTLWP